MEGELMDIRMPEFDLDTFKSDTRFADCTLLENPTPFKDLFPGTDFSRVEIILCAKDPNFIGFVGAFAYIDSKVVPLDGDSYSDEMIVYAYKEAIVNEVDNGLIVVSNTF